jgi:hypothetical protein
VGLLTVASVITVVPGVAPDVIPGAVSVANGATSRWATEADRVLEDGRQHLGQPYFTNGYGGYTRNIGGYQRLDTPVDCKGFVWIVLHETGHDKSNTGVKRLTNGSMPSRVYGLYTQLKSHLPAASIETASSTHQLSTGTLKPGDLIIFGTEYMEDYVRDKKAAAAAGHPWSAGRVGTELRKVMKHVAFYEGERNGHPLILHATSPQVKEEELLELSAPDRITYLIHTGLSSMPASSNPLPAPPVGYAGACNPKSSAYDLFDIGCPTMFGIGYNDQVWAHPINGQSVGNVPVHIDWGYPWCMGNEAPTPQSCLLFLPNRRIWTARDLTGDKYPDLLALGEGAQPHLLLFPGKKSDSTHARVGQPWDLGVLSSVNEILIGNFDGAGTELLVVPTYFTGKSSLYSWDPVSHSLYGRRDWWELGQYDDVLTSGDVDGDGRFDILARKGNDIVLLGSRNATGSTRPPELPTCSSCALSNLKWSEYLLLDSIGDLNVGALKSTPLLADTTRAFQMPWLDAAAITANLVAVKPTKEGYFTVLPEPRPDNDPPTTSSVNFGVKQTVASNLTAMLGASGRLSVYYGAGHNTKKTPGQTADVIVDVQGYFDSEDGATYYPMDNPIRLADSRDGDGGLSQLRTGSWQTIDDPWLVNLDPVAVTGVLTVYNPSAEGYLAIRSDVGTSTATPTFSNLNFAAHETRSVSATVSVEGGRISVYYRGNKTGATADATFDVTGYYVDGDLAYGYVPITPKRLVDSRDGTGLQVSLKHNQPALFLVSSWTHNPVPASAVAVTGVLTVTGATGPGYVSLTTNKPPSTGPTTSTIHFAAGKDVANGVTIKLEDEGSGLTGAWVTYESAPGKEVHVIFDVTGYYVNGSGYSYHPLTEPLRAVDSRYDRTGDVLAVKNDGTLWAIPGGCGKPYQLGKSTGWNPQRTAVIGIPPSTPPSGYVPTPAPSTSPVPTPYSYAYAAVYHWPSAQLVDGVSEELSSAVGTIPAIVNTESIEVPVDLVDPGETLTGIELWSRHQDVETGEWSAWYLTAISPTSPIELPFYAGDGLYELFSVASDAEGRELKTEAEASIYLDTSGQVASRVAAFGDAFTNNPALTVAYGAMTSASGAALSKVELYQRFQPAGGSFGSWTLVRTATGSFGIPFSVTETADGTYEFYALAYDVDGNTETKTAAEASITLDTYLGPSTIAGLDPSYASGPANLSYSTSESSSGSGIAAVDLYYRYKPRSTDSWPAAWAGFATEREASGTIAFTFDDGQGYYQFYTAASDLAGNAEGVPGAGTTPKASTKYLPAVNGATYKGLPTPVRVVDSRPSVAKGVTGPLAMWQPKTFQVAGTNGIPANATGVTGSVKVTGQTNAGYLALGPNVSAEPEFSTVNFPATGNYAAGVTVGLASDGSLGVVLDGSATTPNATANVVFDVTGYFVPGTGESTYYPLTTPTRMVDSRTDLGITGALTGWTAKTFQVTGKNGIPAGATSVTGTVTVVSQSAAGYFAIEPTANNAPTWSTLDFPTGAGYSASFTGALSSSGSLSVLYRGTTYSTATAHVIVDITGFFVAGSGGAQFIAVAPGRLVDTRAALGLGVPLSAGVPTTFEVAGEGGVPAYAVAVAGNPTVTSQSGYGYVAVGATVTANPGWSTNNFAATGDNSSGVTTALGSGGTLSVVYGATSGTTDFVFDVTGYFVAPIQGGSPISWISGFAGGLTKNATVAVPYGVVTSASGVPLSKVELYQRFKPMGGSFGSWTVAKTATSSFGTPFSVTETTDGTYEFYTRAYDVDGNTEVKTAAEASIILDRTAGPSTIGSLPAAYSSMTIAIPYTATEPSGAAGIDWVDLYFRFKAKSTDAWPATWQNFGRITAATGSFTFTSLSGPGLYQFYTRAADNLGNVEAVPGASTSPKASANFDPSVAAATYYPLATPVRVVDSLPSVAKGITGPLTKWSPKTFQVAGANGIPANATGVTGSLKVTGQTAAGFLALGPNVGAHPGFSTVNFPATGNYAAGVTVGLTSDGKLGVVLDGPATTPNATANVVFDVTGYFVPGTGGSTYYPLTTPQRYVDSRSNLGITGALTGWTPKTFQVTGRTIGGITIPAGATAVTGTVTVVNQSASGYLTVEPAPVGYPGYSTLDFPTGAAYSSSFTSALSSDGKLSLLYRGTKYSTATAHVIVDITGYFKAGSGGAQFIAVAPQRVVDTRADLGLTNPLTAKAPATFRVTSVPTYAVAVAGNPTVTNQSASSYIAVGPTATASPGWSTCNFPAAGDFSAGVTTALGSGGMLSVVYGATSGTTEFVFDVTGYFVMPVQ